MVDPDEDDEFTVVTIEGDESSHEVFDEMNKQETSMNRTMELYSETVLEECSHCRALETPHAEMVKELHEKNESVIMILEEQQLAIKHANDIASQNEKLEMVIMNTAARMRELIEENEQKDKILGKLEQNQQEVRDVNEKEISLFKDSSR